MSLEQQATYIQLINYTNKYCQKNIDASLRDLDPELQLELQHYITLHTELLKRNWTGLWLKLLTH